MRPRARKGIGAESALALARDSGAAIVLLGRSDAADDAPLAENLRRFECDGVRHRYIRASVTDATAVRDAVASVRDDLGPVTAIVHCAGVNEPGRIAELGDETMAQTVAAKVGGLRNLLAAVDGDNLRLVVTFGSIIGRTGLRGEAHYALANDWLALEVARVRRELPAARCLNIEWSVWSGAGMGERLVRSRRSPHKASVRSRWTAASRCSSSSRDAASCRPRSSPPDGSARR